MTSLKATMPSRENCIYTPYYCEENIWHLCQDVLKHGKPENNCYCVFISNHLRAVHLWKQRICTRDNQYVVWDYHVFALYGNYKDGYYVVDLDTVLSFPVSFKEYVKEALRPQEKIIDSYRRVIPAEEYLKHFSSDRRHMKINGLWQKPPPNYSPIILNQSNPYNLDEFINMEKGKGYGEVFNQEEFIKKFGI